jgi:hypothetical protein
VEQRRTNRRQRKKSCRWNSPKTQGLLISGYCGRANVVTDCAEGGS